VGILWWVGILSLLLAWGDNPVSSCRSYSRAKGPGASAGAFPKSLSYLERVQGVLEEVPRGPGGPPWPPLGQQPCA
jgi:hypothetical protein